MMRWASNPSRSHAPMHRLLAALLLFPSIGCGRKDPASMDVGASTRCGAGFVARAGGRCCQAGDGACTRAPRAAMRVVIPARRFEFGASDWEARGRVASRRIETAPFSLDVYELTRADVGLTDDPARAASGLSRDEARAWCKQRGGRLPTDDEWLAAAATTRYPWGETGLVCRRAAWGLAHGPCARGADGPDTVGAHPDGRSPEGVHDLTGNVAEWVETPGGEGRVRGGSFADDFAGSLRSWAERAVDPTSHDAQVGARCAYDTGVGSTAPPRFD